MSFLIFLVVAVLSWLVFCLLLPLFESAEQQQERDKKEIAAALRAGQIASKQRAYWKGKTPPPGWM